MAKFSDFFSESPRKDVAQPRINVTWLHYTKLVRSRYQFYSEDEEEIRNLADLIQLDGEVLQELIVRKTDADTYEIVSGHKRWLASKILFEERKLEKYAFLPCQIKKLSDVQAEFQVMAANQYRKKTPYETMCEIESMKKLMEQHPEEFSDEELRGRMVEALSRKLNIDRSVVSDYQNISHNLGEAGKEAFKEGKIKKSAATALAGLPKEEQEELLNEGIVSRKEIVKYKRDKERQKEPMEQECPTDVSSCILREWETTPEQQHEESRVCKSEEMQDTVETAKKNPEDASEVENLKNMEQREEFVLGYRSWSVWCKNELTEETFFRYDLPDGSAIVVKSYPYKTCNQKEQEGRDFYLLKPDTKHFKNAESCMTMIKEHLKEIQKSLN